MHTTKLAALLALTASVSADFYLSNSTTCMGAFPVSQCYHGPVVFSGLSNITDYTCPKLLKAHDNFYIWNGTAGPTGSPELFARKSCGLDYEMHFVKEGQQYKGQDGSGKEVATCDVASEALVTRCPEWIGTVFFETEYLCKSDIDCT